MPVKVKKRQRVNRNNLDQLELVYLMTGCDFCGGDFKNQDERMRGLWQKYKAFVMEWYTQPLPEQTEENRITIRVGKPAPGRRPWAWWEWDAPEPLPDRPEPCENWPAVCAGCHWGHVTHNYSRARYCGKAEPETEYLRRLNLLTDSEKRLLGMT